MNKVALMGRLTKDPIVRYTQGNQPMAIARFTLAVDRRTKKEGEQNADFISCVAFGKMAETIEKYISKGRRLAVVGRIQTGSYDGKDGKKIYTTDVIVEEMDFCDSKTNGNEKGAGDAQKDASGDEFMKIPDTWEELPFN